MAIPKYLEGKYEILDTLQESGMGAVYKVRHRLLEEVRVAKVLRLPREDSFHQRLLSEMRAATRLSHPNIARIFDCAVDEDGLIIVMERVQGITLAELLSTSEPLPLALTLEVTRQGLRAIGHLHERELVSRDVSPDNLALMVDDLGRPLLKLIDPGIARDVEGDRVSAGPGGAPTSGRDNFRVQLRYAAPEAFEEEGQESIDLRRSDLYSFALVIYELLTGRFPISGTGPSSLIAGHLFRPPLDFAESDPGGRVPEQIRRAVLQALAKSPGERFADAMSFAAEIPEPDEMSLATARVLRILEWAESGIVPDEPLKAQTPVPDPGLDSAPTRIMTTQVPEKPVTEAPTVILRPSAAGAESPVVAPDEPTRILRPSFGDPPPAEALEGPETRRLSREEVLALRLEASSARESTALEESTTVIRSASADLASPEPPPESVASDLSQAAAGSAQEKTVTSPTPRAVSAPSLDLDATLDSIRALRDRGRAGEAFEKLNHAVRDFGPQPELRSLRHELTEALLDQDADDESASQMFGQVSGPGDLAGADEVTQTVLPGSVPAPIPNPVPESSSLEATDERAPRANASDPEGAPELAEATIRGLSDATFRSLEPPALQDRDRSEPPIAHPTRNMVLVGLILVVVFAGLVFFLTRSGPGSERHQIETEDVAAADLSPGSLVLDAVPWAEIVSLENPAAEESPPISPSRFTPVILTLPPGEYRLSLRYPPTGQVEDRVIRIDSDARVEERVIFENLDGEAYFQRIGW